VFEGSYSLLTIESVFDSHLQSPNTLLVFVSEIVKV